MNVIEKTRKEQFDRTLNKVLNTILTGQEINVSIIQRRCSAGYYSASGVFQFLNKNGMIVNENGKKIIR